MNKSNRRQHTVFIMGFDYLQRAIRGGLYGGTVVIGGVYIQDESRSIGKVPLLGDIPFIGWLFKNQANKNEQRELLVFISPKILSENLNLR